MKLDFLTLYLIILLNSVIFCVVWAGFAYVHRNIPGARYWLAASVLTMLGGLLMAGDGTPYGRALMIAGNAVVVCGFVMIWCGIRVFYGRPVDGPLGAMMVGLAVFIGVIADDTRPSQNIAYAVTQLIPMGVVLATLLRHGYGSLGAGVAAAGFAVAIAGQGTEATLNAMRIAGELSTASYYRVAALLLVAVIFGAGIWNLGFLLMAIDRLRDKLIRLATYDELTDVPNRRAFVDGARAALKDAMRRGRPLVLMIIDLDNFKTINDQLGHGAGDACLRHFAELCGEAAGARGGIGRLGGDEFAMLLPEMGGDEALVLAESLVGRVALSPLPWRGGAIRLTASIGVAALEATGARTVEELLEAADIALYQTKRRGRNGATLWDAASDVGFDTGLETMPRVPRPA